MSNLFMLVNYSPFDKSIGITKKISAQISAFRRLGFDVYYTAYTELGVAVFAPDDSIIREIKFNPVQRKLSGFIRYSELLKNADKFVSKSGISFDYLYGRISAPTKKYIRFLDKFKSMGAKVIIEALSYFPGVKPKAIKSRYIAFYLEKNKDELKKVIDRFITEGEVENFYGIPTQKGKIGVETDKLPRHIYNGDKDELNMISVAAEREYHGYDRLIKSLKAYVDGGGNHKVKLHLVGKLYDSTLKMIDDLGLNGTVITYGKVYGDKLFEIYDFCNVGVGPLGQHRIGGKKDTGLKTKEYFGLGLPYFYSGVEEDVDDGFPFIFQVPSDESLVDIDAIWNFYESFRDNDSAADIMRDYARNVFSWDVIMSGAIDMERTYA